MKKVLAVFLSLMVLGAAYAEPSIYDITSEFPKDRMNAFLSGETIEYYQWEKAPALAFDGTVAKEKAISDAAQEDAFSVALATFVEYPESWEHLSFSEKKLIVINTLLKVSAIKGITYISHQAGDAPKVLFEDAYTILDPKKAKKASDAYFSYAPENYNYQLYAHLKDSIFGGNNYAINYDIQGSEIFMTITNLSDLKFLFFKAVSKNELDMCVDAVLTKEGIALFALSTVYGREEQVKTPVTTVDLPSAFMKRITSLKDWFSAEIEK